MKKAAAKKAIPAKQITTPISFTAKQFIEELKKLQIAAELKKIRRYFKSGEGVYGKAMNLLARSN